MDRHDLYLRNRRTQRVVMQELQDKNVLAENTRIATRAAYKQILAEQKRELEEDAFQQQIAEEEIADALINLKEIDDAEEKRIAAQRRKMRKV